MATTTSKVLFRGAATTNTATTLYTVPTTGTTAVVTSIIITNTAASGGTYTLAIDGTAIATTVSIAANDTVIMDLKQVIPANATPKIISGGASAITINFHISGVEIA